jgi:hypothetical protein
MKVPVHARRMVPLALDCLAQMPLCREERGRVHHPRYRPLSPGRGVKKQTPGARTTILNLNVSNDAVLTKTQNERSENAAGLRSTTMTTALQGVMIDVAQPPGILATNEDIDLIVLHAAVMTTEITDAADVTMDTGRTMDRARPDHERRTITTATIATDRGGIDTMTTGGTAKAGETDTATAEGRGTMTTTRAGRGVEAIAEVVAGAVPHGRKRPASCS